MTRKSAKARDNSQKHRYDRQLANAALLRGVRSVPFMWAQQSVDVVDHTNIVLAARLSLAAHETRQLKERLELLALKERQCAEMLTFWKQRCHVTEQQLERVKSRLHFALLPSDQDVLDSLAAISPETKPFLIAFFGDVTKNRKKMPRARRYSDTLYIFSSYLRSRVGVANYEYIRKNFDFLPGCTSLDRFNGGADRIHPGLGLGLALSTMLQGIAVQSQERQYAGMIFVSEDATRCLSVVEYNVDDNTLLGFVPVEGKCDAPIADSFDAIVSAFETRDIATQVYVYCASTMRTDIPPAFLAGLPSNNVFNASTIRKNWQLLRQAAAVHSLDIR